MTKLSKEAMREYMRNRRKGDKDSVKSKESVEDEHGVVTPVEDVYDKAKYPNRAAWEIAVIRAQRAKKYALACPGHVSPADLKFQTVQWQYEFEGLPAVKKMFA